MPDFPPPKPFHRSRLFWLGLLVLVFFVWSWSESRRFDSWVAVGVSKSAMVILRQGEGRVGIEVVRDKAAPFSAASFASARSDRKSDPFYEYGDPPAPWFPPAFSHFAWELGNGHQEQESWVAAWWAIIATYLTIWLGALVMRQRRKARLWRASIALHP